MSWENYYEDKWFPYTPPVSDIEGLRAAVDSILEDKDVLERHSRIGRSVRKVVKEAGLNLYTEDGYSNTITAIEVPDGIDEAKLRKYMVDNFNVLIAGSFGYLQGKVIRIGHMGENVKRGMISYTLYSLQKSLEHFGFHCNCDMDNCFLKDVDGLK